MLYFCKKYSLIFAQWVETYKKCFGAKSRYPKLGTSSERKARAMEGIKNWTKKHSSCRLKCNLNK